ncbi:MAG TPA: FAD-dependent monooxygenase [Polyangia bacterium]|jgi:2-polyprenyl-6-methoxyphenol hydroxylase-like FAD-dependent oxidoreductase
MILVVGAGPTGLSMAIELQRRGVPFRIIDKATARSDKSRALAVQARSLELMRPWGVADELVAAGAKVYETEWYIEKKPSAKFEFGDLGIDDTPYPHLLFASQADTERLSEAALERLGARVERGVELVNAIDRETFVDVTLRHGDRVEATRVAWVVGCDGAHSEVRHAAALPFEGAAYDQDFVLADLAIDWDLPERLYFFLGKGQNAVVFPLKNGDKRIIAMGGARPADAADEPSLDEVQALLAGVCPHPFRFGAVRWKARFRLHHRGVSRYRAGRLFVAGDAAHIHSPAGGQGMNTGIQDAINLAWKLALVAEGRAPESLLDSYDEERRPVGQRLLQFTDRLFSVATSANPVLIWARNRLLPVFAPLMMRTAARRKIAFRFVSQIAINYRGSSLVGECGERAPDAIVDSGKHLVDAYKDPKHHLVVFGDGREFLRAATARYAPELDGIVVREDEARRRYRIDGDGWVLVRPDQYIAARAQSFDDAPLDAYFGARIGMSSSKRSM